MVERKRAEEAALSKPKFLSKEERTAEALKKRQQQVIISPIITTVIELLQKID